MFTLSLSGCTVLSSDLPAALNGDAPSGVHYYLPKNVFELLLSVDPATARFRVVIGDAQTIIDQSRSYYLKYRPLPQYDDHVTINVNAKGLLTSVTSDSTDQTPNILKDLATGVGKFAIGLEAASAPANEAQLVRLVVDLTNPHEVEAAVATFNKEIRSYSDVVGRSACKPDPEAKIVLDVQKYALCDQYAQLRHPQVQMLVKPLVDTIDLGATRVRHRGEPTQTTSDADCSEGICYRPAQAYEVAVAIGRQGVSRTIFLSPNRAPLVSIDIRRAFFVNKVQEVTFDGETGALLSMRVKKDSELLAVAGLPIAILNNIGDGLQIRVKILETKIGSATAKSDLIKERANLDKKRAMLQAAMVIAKRQASASSFSSVPRIAAPTGQSGTFLDNAKPVQ